MLTFHPLGGITDVARRRHLDPLLLADQGAVTAPALALQALAGEAVMLIRARIRAGEPAATVVAEVVGLVFGGDDDRAPLLPDRAELDRVAATVLALVEAEPLY